MFFFLPFGVEGFRVRIPLVSVCIALMCVLAFLFTWVANDDREEGLNQGELAAAVRMLEAHPYLRVPEWFAKQYLKLRDRQGLEAVRQEWLNSHELPAEVVIADEQAQLDRHFEAAIASLDANPMRRWAFVPNRGLLQAGLITHMFLHWGWLHLLGNLLFFALCAPMLEDAWGRSLFGVVYFLGGLAAVFAQFLLDRHTPGAMVGASGAIAACMGAFAVRFATRRVLIGYFIFVGFRFFRGVWRWSAWVCGVLWFGNQILELAIGGSTGVALMAHIGGFAFGAFASLGMKAIGLEKDLIGSSELDESPLEQSFTRQTMLAHAALRQGDVETARQRFGEVAATDDDAAVGLLRLDFEQGRREAALRGFDTLMLRLLRAKAEGRASMLLRELWPRLEPADVRPPTAAALARLVDGDGGQHLAMLLYERGGDAPGFVGVKALVRALELALGERDGGRATTLLARLKARSELGPFAEQVDVLAHQVRRLATLQDAPVSAENPMPEPQTEQVLIAPVIAPAQHEHGFVFEKLATAPSPEVTRCVITALNDDGVIAQLSEGGGFETISWPIIVAIGAGVVPRSPSGGGVLMVDLVVSRASARTGPKCYRFDSDSTAMSALFPATTAQECYRAFFTRVLERTQAVVALPEIGALTGRAFSRYSSIEARDQALYAGGF